VNTPTHIAGLLEFAGGAIGTIVTSFDTWSHHLPCIEIYGSEGTLSVPDPNGFGGSVRVWRTSDRQWNEVPLIHEHSSNSRGLGVADMAHAMRVGRPHRASGEMALHVLDLMQSFHESSAEGKHIDLTTTCTRPAPFPGTSVWENEY
jgi:predicted dehydrogenase